jgi:neutral trehalase
MASTSTRCQRPKGALLNRYYDDMDTPRPEAYKEDIEIAHYLFENRQKYIETSVPLPNLDGILVVDG